jgi:uncharacterized protein
MLFSVLLFKPRVKKPGCPGTARLAGKNLYVRALFSRHIAQSPDKSARATAVNQPPRHDPDDLFHEGLTLFNSAHFFEAHEVLEDVWRPAPQPERKFLQGLIQVAVALHHYSRGNRVGCRSVLERAHRNLSAYPAEHMGVDLHSLRQSVDAWRSALDRGALPPALPLISLKVSQ